MGREGVHLPDGGGAEDAGRLFDGRSQLVVYHFMFGPDYTAGCPTCSSIADSFTGVLPHLQARDDLRLTRAARETPRLPRADGPELHLGVESRQ
jgi:predicted dithiol-disulfide oxidoreductase (DUF899 family)